MRALAETRLKTKSDSMLRTFLAFKAIAKREQQPDAAVLKEVVTDLFVVLPTPEHVRESRFSGTIGLRGTQGKVSWLRNDSYRGAFMDYAGPSGSGRFMFEDEEWRLPLKDDAIDRVAETLDRPGYDWPPGEALAAIVLRNDLIDPSSDWADLVALARDKFGLAEDEWRRITVPVPLGVKPFDDPPWDPDRLSAGLQPPGAEDAERSELELESLPPALKRQVQEVSETLSRHGSTSIVALAGVPGTSKSHVARIAARAFATEGCLREIQFSPGNTYEEFMEGPRYTEGMKVEILPGVFLELNEEALQNPGNQYVLLIEELTRADLPRVLGELVTYIEYRNPEDTFATMYNRADKTRVAPNIAILATYNPTDRSAVNVDSAILRRMRILDFPPNLEMLSEILGENGLDEVVIAQIASMFEACRSQAGEERFAEVMPFGHGVFASVESEADLYFLWHQELKRMLRRPNIPRHELYETIAENFPWKDSSATTVVDSFEPTEETAGEGDGIDGSAAS
jgi:5-methylcytosine-specific restriction protein B